MAGGLGRQLGIDPVVVRLAFVVLSAAGGFGVILYLLAWLAGTEADDEPAGERPDTGIEQLAAVGLVVAGAMLLLRSIMWFGDGLAVSVGLAAFGSAVIWTRSDDAGRTGLARMAARLPRAAAGEGVSKTRVAAGAVLVVGGMATFLAASNAISALGQALVAVVVTAGGLFLILGPWVWRLGRQLGEERRERIRSEERAELAAHLHDSVLQTLALIQRSDNARQMATLARGQERELRTWLYGRHPPGQRVELLSAAIDRAAARVEELHQVVIEVVVVGDCELDDRLRAMIEAAREAMSNAAKHSGVTTVSVYAEVSAEELRIYVRDQGRGFDPAGVTDSRRGIADSIRGRMERNGGTATIVSAEGEGTEVTLRMPRTSQ